MHQLRCEVCGGKLKMADDRKSSVCESCGVEYSLNAMKDMINALQGVELKVQGISTVQSLVDYAESLLGANIYEAEAKYKEALAIDPRCSAAWKGLFDIQTYFLELSWEDRFNYLRTGDFTELNIENNKSIKMRKDAHKDLHFRNF